MFNFGPKVPQVEVQEVKNNLDKKTDCILLDVRTPEEFSKNRIQKSVNIPLDTLENNLGSQIPQKDALIYVYCLSGSRSCVAVDAMTRLGYTNVFDMKSGLLAWRASQFPLES